MTKFHALLFRFLPNGSHYSFFERATSELAKAGDDVKDAVEPLDTELNKWFALETANMAWYRYPLSIVNSKWLWKWGKKNKI